MSSRLSSISSRHPTMYQRGANREPIYDYQCPLVQINDLPGILCQLFGS